MNNLRDLLEALNTAHESIIELRKELLSRTGQANADYNTLARAVLDGDMYTALLLVAGKDHEKYQWQHLRTKQDAWAASEKYFGRECEIRRDGPYSNCKIERITPVNIKAEYDLEWWFLAEDNERYDTYDEQGMWIRLCPKWRRADRGAARSARDRTLSNLTSKPTAFEWQPRGSVVCLGKRVQQ